ncbi:MAG: hypothetical protein COC12_04375 [Rhodobacteraceae bacterium]|nr:MAG: hypothetical protein COC12_04375 [Paracoccaceae bacterium]
MNIPEVIPRISQKRIHGDPSIGCGVQLRQKYKFLIVMGVFGPRATLRTVCQRMYVTSTFIEPRKNKRTGDVEKVEVLNDESAYNRLDNTFRVEDKPLIQAELDFLRRCFEHVFGVEAMASTTDDLLLRGSIHKLLRNLMGATTKLDWNGIDPILALQAIACTTDPMLEVNIETAEITRWTKLDKQPEPVFPAEDCQVLPAGTGYRLFLDAQVVRERPLVFEFAEVAEGRDVDGEPVRAQMLPKAILSEDGVGPWRVAKRMNQPLQLGHSEGRFGFCAISGLGLAFDDLFPKGFNPARLSNADLRFLVGQLTEQFLTGNPPVVGIRRYSLTKTDAK